MADKASIDPSFNHLTTVDGETFDEEVRVTLAAKGVIPTIDVYFVTDATGSMADVINEVNKRSREIVDGLRQKAESVGADLRIGVGNYTDFDVQRGTRGFTHQQSLTSDYDKAREAIANWSTTGNNTTAEQQLYALDTLAQPPGGDVGWREEAKRIILWFGDAPGHEPIDQDTSGKSHEITTRSTVAQLQAQDIFVLAFDTTGNGGGSSPGLDTDPDDHGNIGKGGAERGQASTITGATHGQVEKEIKVDQVVQKILDIGGAAITELRDVKLVPSRSIRPFVGNHREIGPRGGERTLQGGQEHDLTFDVPFAGLSRSVQAPPPDTEPVLIQGTLDLYVDGSRAAQKKVDIDVPNLSGAYKIQNTKSTYFLETDPNYKKNGGLVRQGPGSDGDHQKWDLTPVSGGGYNIRNRDLGRDRYIEVKGQSSEEKAEILTSDDPNGKHKQWQPIPTGADDQGHLSFRLQNVNATQKAKKKMVIDLSGRKDPTKSKIIQWKYWGDYPDWEWEHNQHFRLFPV